MHILDNILFVKYWKDSIILNKIIMINTSIFTFAITDWLIKLKVTCQAKQYPVNISLWYKQNKTQLINIHQIITGVEILLGNIYFIVISKD